KGREAGMSGAPMQMPHADHASSSASGHGSEAPAAADVSCSPTWAHPSRTTSSVFVACNGSSEIVEIDLRDWKLVRRIPARAGGYNLGMPRGRKLDAANSRQ